MAIMTDLADIFAEDTAHAVDLQSAIGIGLEAADKIDEGRWRIYNVARSLVPKHGRGVIAEFGIAINLRKSAIYEGVATLEFYGDGNIIELTADRMVTYSHMRDAMRVFRKLHPDCEDNARDAALAWLEVVANEALTVEVAGVRLKELYGIPPASAIRFTGVPYASSPISEHHMMIAVDSIPVDLVMGQQYTFTARTVSAQAERGE